MITHNLIKYLKKDNKYMSIKKKATENIDSAYKQLSGIKNTMKNLKKELKLQYNEKTKKRDRNTKKK